MTLDELIAELESIPNQGAIIRRGFGKPDSYRGIYAEVAFEPAENVSVASMLDHARFARGKTFSGYKGGEYTMDGYVACYISTWGEASGDQIGQTLVSYWRHEAQS